MLLESGFSVLGAKNASRLKGDADRITLDVLFEGYEEYVPFTASKNDSYDHGVDLFERAEAGEFGEVLEIEDTSHLLKISNISERLINRASSEISHLQDCVDVEEATEEEMERYLKLKKFRVTINRLRQSPEWPKVTLPEYPESSK